MMKIAGFGSASGSESISQRHRFADPDPHQNVMDPQRNTAIRGHLITEAAAGTTGGGSSVIQQSKKDRVIEK
jgi:hypothetical protein